ncbi:MAG: alpha/beta fold hydrolase [Desulfobacterales bacterium]
MTYTLPAHDGIPMACDCGGQGEPRLLFVHGWTCRRAYWLPQLKHFSADFRVAAPDLPGHGDTGSHLRSQWGVVAFSRDIAACVRELGDGQVILIGHSMGGAVALEAARRLKDAALAVILVDTFVIDYGGLTAEAIQEIAAPFETDFCGAVAGLVEQTATAATPQALKERLVREMSEADPACALPVWRDLLAWNPRPAFEELKIPIYAINGALIPESARRRCAPFVQETIIPGSGHFLQMEDPPVFNHALEKILAGRR